MEFDTQTLQLDFPISAAVAAKLDAQTLQLDFPISAAAPWSKNSLQEPSSGEFVNQDGPILLKSSQVQLASTCGGGEFVSLDASITAEIFASLISLNVPGGAILEQRSCTN